MAQQIIVRPDGDINVVEVGPVGPPGVTPTVTSATVVSLSPGSTPTVTISGSAEALEIEFGIPIGGAAPAYPTLERPLANELGAGHHYFDTNLNKPIWSDGTQYRDANGNVS